MDSSFNALIIAADVRRRNSANMKIKAAPVVDYAAHIPFHQLANQFQVPLGIIISATEVLESYFDRLTPERRRMALQDVLNAARQMSLAVDSMISSEFEKNQRSSRSNKA